jgi:hypothetical protein
MDFAWVKSAVKIGIKMKRAKGDRKSGIRLWQGPSSVIHSASTILTKIPYYAHNKIRSLAYKCVMQLLLVFYVTGVLQTGAGEVWLGGGDAKISKQVVMLYITNVFSQFFPSVSLCVRKKKVLFSFLPTFALVAMMRVSVCACGVLYARLHLLKH